MRHDERAGHALRGDAAGGHKVGVQNGTIQVPIANELAGEDNVVGLVKAQDLIMELKSGKLDVVYIDYTPSLAFAAANDDLLVQGHRHRERQRGPVHRRAEGQRGLRRLYENTQKRKAPD